MQWFYSYFILSKIIILDLYQIYNVEVGDYYMIEKKRNLLTNREKGSYHMINEQILFIILVMRNSANLLRTIHGKIVFMTFYAILILTFDYNIILILSNKNISFYIPI